jgi:hypothetical protein
MISNPAVLALLAGSAVVCAVTLVAAAAGLSIARGWDPEDWGARQLARERRTLLVESTVKVALACQLVSLFLFVATAERLHPLFTGAMCAAGTLNASRFGYPTLLVKLAVFLLCGLWLVVHRASAAATSTALVRAKHLSVSVVAAALLAENVLQARYFTDLDPQILTSCCATLFGREAGGIAAGVATLPVRESQAAFFGALALTLGVGLGSRGRGRSPVLFSVLAVILGLVSLTAVVTWVAPAFYQLPTHHCPFCLLSSTHALLGYPLYACLLTAVVTGAGAGLVHALRALDPQGAVRAGEERRLCAASMTGFALFCCIALWPVLASGSPPGAY